MTVYYYLSHLAGITINLQRYYLSHLAGITINLQRRAQDILEAHEMVNDVQAMNDKERRTVDTGFSKVYSQCIRLATEVGTTESMPRIAGRRRHRSNPPSETPEDYFKKTVAIPLLDHVKSSLETQFSAAALVSASLIGIVPSICCTRDVDLEQALATYEQDLPSLELFSAELNRWKRKFKETPEENRPASPVEAIKQCDGDLFPNIRVLLQIACILPVTSCECECSASALHRLHNYMRASMGTSRLSSLALLHVHYDREVNLEEFVHLFAAMHPRRMELDSLVK